MKTLKEQGVPFGARMLFRLQWLPFLGVSLLLVVSLPFVCLWGLVHESGVVFLRGCCDVLEDRVKRIEQHRDKVLSLYSKGAA